MSSDKTITLDLLSNQKLVELFLEDTLYETLGIRDRLSVPDLWSVGREFISPIALEVTNKIDEVGKKLGEKKFKNFSSSKTKLTKEILEEIWIEVSSLLAKRIEKLYTSGTHEIPGLEKLLKETAFFPGIKSPFKMHTKEHKEYFEEKRKDMLNNIESTNDAQEFVAKFRNKYFNYLRREYGAFDEPTAEIKGTTKLH
jgi:hypothetical protein